MSEKFPLFETLAACGFIMSVVNLALLIYLAWFSY